MKFDYVIGNPPYQSSTDTYNRQEPIYPYFYDAAEKISNKSLLISPARFLFNAGLTSKEWNKKMLSDVHVKVEYYNQNASEVFPNTEIKGGVAVVYRDCAREFGAINEFIPDESLRRIAEHFHMEKQETIISIMYGGRSDLKFNDIFLNDYPESIQYRLNAVNKKHPDVKQLATNEEYELKSSTLETLDYVFEKEEPHNIDGYYKIIGLVGGKREFRWINKKYMNPRYPDNNNINEYKVIFPEANGNGQFGEVISQPIVIKPNESATPTFISIGKFKTLSYADNLLKYIKTKFTRALLGIVKKTQHTAPSNWKYVPLQDFTSSSDIDWSKSISEIDQQLYRKYGLTDEEIEFIETHVKPME